MPALAHRRDALPRPAAADRARLRAVPSPRRRRVPAARALALYALGLTAGFLLAGVASLPGGGDVVAGQVGLAAAAALVGGLAALRARAVARRRFGLRM
ncbi:MAG TPA: hypothetical protein VHK00_01395 [Miltoncostaeaceae bacterium]|jgi:hypothetical protein|nr:hypothetical protein [Miltoncostaeaceae bacterium]